MLAVIIASFLFCLQLEFPDEARPDMKGGTNLIYDILPPADAVRNRTPAHWLLPSARG